jgi:hypothetical protein
LQAKQDLKAKPELRDQWVHLAKPEQLAPQVLKAHAKLR